MVKEEGNILRSAGIVGLFTFLSRILGLLRDIVLANYFGATMAADAFYVAFRIPNLLRRLLAEGALSISFVPIFTDYITKQGRAEAFRVARITFTLITFILLLVSGLGIFYSPKIVALFAPGFFSQPEKFALTVKLNQIMFPFIFFIGLVALSMGVLNSLNYFAAPAFAPICLNLAIISSTILLYDSLEEPIQAVAIGVILGGLSQLVLQVYFLRKAGMRFGLDFNFAHVAIKKMGLLFGPAVLGVAVYHLDVFVSTILASLLEEGSISYLYYATRFFEFPQGIFVISIATVVLPTLSRYGSQGNLERFKAELGLALRLVSFITIPATVGLIILRVPLIRLFFQRGVFDAHSSWATAQALFYYSLGLWSVAGARIIVQSFYSLKDTKTPAFLAFLTFIINLLLSLILMDPMSYRGLALANSLASYFNFAALSWSLKKRIGKMPVREYSRSLAKIILSSALMGLGIYVYYRLFLYPLPTSSLDSALFICGNILLGIGIFLVSSYILRVEELKIILGGRRR
jgi:putative peptidoglycan lipid II flippase